MTETKFTPGPWRRCTFRGIEDVATKSVVAVMASREKKELDANAHLIAAAPEMYEALEEVLEMFESVSKGIDWGKTFLTADMIRKMNEAPINAAFALRKARGEEHK